MQNPPPGPPPGGDQPGYPPSGQQPPGYPQQPYQQQPYQQPYQSAGGLDKKTSALLSYLLGWVTGVIFLFVGKDDPDVKYHAAQSIVFFGGMTVVFWVLRFVDATIGFPASLLLGLIWFALVIYSVVVWIMCLVRANSYRGARFQIPIVGSLVTPLAEQLANAV